MSGKLVVVRHGESEWNARGVWTGTTDVHLSKKGANEAGLMGQCLSDIKFDLAYVSEQVRAKETLDGIAKTNGQGQIPFKVTSAFNERDYGDYTGKNKWEVQKIIGEESFNKLRRAWDYPVPHGETLKDVYERCIPFYTGVVTPKVLAGQTILVVGHGNSIRSLVKYIENISDGNIAKVEMIFGTALVYELDKDGRMASKTERHIETTPPPA